MRKIKFKTREELYDEVIAAVRQRQRAERHRAYKDAALWFACAAVLLWVVKSMVGA